MFQIMSHPNVNPKLGQEIHLGIVISIDIDAERLRTPGSFNTFSQIETVVHLEPLDTEVLQSKLLIGVQGYTLSYRWMLAIHLRQTPSGIDGS